jgi:hypothetical protein
MIPGWVDVWRSSRSWAAAIERTPDEQFEHGARAFPSDLFHQPDDWDDFDADVRTSTRVAGCNDVSAALDGSLLAEIFGPDFARLRRAVKAELLRYPPPIRLDECDVKGDRDIAPLWIANRIVCQVIAAECVRLRDGRPALLPHIRRRIESADCVRVLCASFEQRSAQ